LLVLLVVLAAAGSPRTVGFAGRPLPPAPVSLAGAAGRAGPLGAIAARTGSLSPAQLTQAIALRDRMPADRRTALDELLGGAPAAVQSYLVAAWAAGHSVPEIEEFASVIAGHGARWLQSRLRPLDPNETGPVQFRGDSISQYDDTTCGSTTIVVVRALADPIYALHLTTAADSGESFQRRLQDEERHVHDETDVLWPKAAGTPPWALSDLLNAGSGVWGARYRWVPVPPVISALVNDVLGQALTAVGHGYPVPLLIGDLIPRHYVLLVSRDAAGALFYEPTSGAVIRLSGRDLRHRDFSLLGFAHLHGAILPSGR
jgi:hypothetical protein